jgi:hypothetical protein
LVTAAVEKKYRWNGGQKCFYNKGKVYIFAIRKL